MPQLHIPHVGQEMVLTLPWTFRLFHERRNDILRERLGLVLPDPDNAWHLYGTHFWNVTLPSHTVLAVDRVYLARRGIHPGSPNYQGSYDSISFRLRPQRKSDLKGRFWAKLSDVNQMHVTMLEA